MVEIKKIKNSDFGTNEAIERTAGSKLEGDDYFSHSNAFGIAQWGIRPDGVFVAQQQTAKRLPAGAYSSFIDGNGNLNFKTMITSGDVLLLFQSGIAENIFKEIMNFWNKKEAFTKAGFLHKRGVLLYGPAGTGKTSIISQVSTQVISKDGVVLHCSNPRVLNLALEQVRTIEPKRPIVCVFEDIDAIIREYGEDMILSLLDGANQVDNILNIASTNYPERLDKRIVSRPRRFDRIYKIPMPEESVKREYLKYKLPKKENLSIWMRKTDGLSFAALSEVIISVLCLGKSLDESVEIMRNLEEGKPSSGEFEKSKSLGFGGDK